MLKTMAIRFEDHSWTNSRGKNSQSALIFKPEDKEKIFSLVKERVSDDIDFAKDFDFWIEENNKKFHYYFYGLEIFQRVSLSKKKTYKSYIADLDAPIRERINYLKAELRKSREGKIFGRPPLLIEELLKQAEQKTLRQYIEESLKHFSDKEYQAFRIALLKSQKCLISNFLSAPEYLWGNLVKNKNNTEYKRLSMGINLFFSNEINEKNTGKISKIIEASIKNELALGDYFLFENVI
ncbi:MAG: hypothetical protein K2X39_04550 [Silvanigrellaceae bacterium]|nr:hypothetical protein [Silvanigrellaceae bacterium]